MVICFKVASDFEPFLPIAVNNRADLRLFPADDKVTLQYNDRVMLSYVQPKSCWTYSWSGKCWGIYQR